MPIVDPRSGAPLNPEAPADESSQASNSDEQLIIDADSGNIQQLLEFSMQVPVLLACWSPEDAPSQSLTTVLEKLAREYNGAFLLAKLNVDENRAIAAQLGVRSMPDVKLVSQGGLVDQLEGEQPEKAIRDWLGRYFPAPEAAPASPEEQAAEALAQGDTTTARTLYEDLIKQYPEHYAYQVELARTLVAQGHRDDALSLLDNLPPEERDAAPARGVRASIEFAEEAPSDEELAALEGRDDSEARFKRALRQVADGAYEAGLEGLLALMKSDRSYGDDAARKTLLRVFDALGADHPLTVTYRRRLFTLLY